MEQVICIEPARYNTYAITDCRGTVAIRIGPGPEVSLQAITFSTTNLPLSASGTYKTCKWRVALSPLSASATSIIRVGGYKVDSVIRATTGVETVPEGYCDETSNPPPVVCVDSDSSLLISDCNGTVHRSSIGVVNFGKQVCLSKTLCTPSRSFSSFALSPSPLRLLP